MLRLLSVALLLVPMITVATLWLAPALLPWNQLEGKVARALGERSGARASVHELRGELLPSPWLEAARVELALQPRVYAEGVRADLGLQDLLRGRISVSRLHIERLSGLPEQIPAALLKDAKAQPANGEQVRLQRIDIDALELLPGHPPWAATIKRQANGWLLEARRDDLRLNASWRPEPARIELSMQPGWQPLPGAESPTRVDLGARVHAAGLEIDHLRMRWPQAQLDIRGEILLDEQQRWRAEGLHLQAQGKAITVGADVVLNGRLDARLHAQGHTMNGFPELDLQRLRVDISDLEGVLHGRGLSTLLPPGSVDDTLAVSSMQAVAEWREQQLALRRIRLHGPDLNIQGYLVIDSRQGLRGELGLFASEDSGHSWQAGGANHSPEWRRGAPLPRR